MRHFEEVEGFTNDIKSSLKEYGLVCRREKADQYHFIYSIPNGYEECFITETEVNELVSGNSYIPDQEIKQFFEKTNTNFNRFLEKPILYKVYSLINYFGYEAIFGRPIYSLTFDEVLNILEKE